MRCPSEIVRLGIEDGWGAFLSYTPTFGDKWLAFVRGGFAEDGGSLLKRSVSIGGGYAPNGIGAPGAGSLLGFGANWGQPNDALFGVDLNDQYTFDAYYRLQVTRELAITPSVFPHCWRSSCCAASTCRRAAATRIRRMIERGLR